MRLYVGRFAAPATRTHEQRVREWANDQRAGAGTIKVFGLDQVVSKLREVALQTEYRDNPVLVTMKVLDAAGMLLAEPSNDAA